MTARLFTAIGSLSRRFLWQSGGSVAPLLALALVPIIGTVGAAVDFSRASDVRTKLQAAVDAAVIAGAHDGTANWTQTALNVFNSQIPRDTSVAPPSFTVSDDKIYSAFPCVYVIWRRTPGQFERMRLALQHQHELQWS